MTVPDLSAAHFLLVATGVTTPTGATTETGATTHQLLVTFFTGAAAAALIALAGIFIRISHERTERRRDRMVDAADQFAAAGARLSDVLADLSTSTLEATSYASAVEQIGPPTEPHIGRPNVLRFLPPFRFLWLRRETTNVRRLIRLLNRLHAVVVEVGDSQLNPDLTETTVEQASPELRTLIADLNELPSSPWRDRALQAHETFGRGTVSCAIHVAPSARDALETGFGGTLQGPEPSSGTGTPSPRRPVPGERRRSCSITAPRRHGRHRTALTGRHRARPRRRRRDAEVKFLRA